MSFVHKPDALAFALTALFVLGLVAYRLLWLASQLAAGVALGRLPGLLSKRLRGWLSGENQYSKSS